MALTFAPTSTHPPGSFLDQRAFGSCAWDDRSRHARITLDPKAFETPDAVVLGVLAHEFGHAQRFAAGHPDHTEIDADRMGARVAGQPIFYTPGLWVQTLAPTQIRRRPRTLDMMLAKARAPRSPASRGNPAPLLHGCTDGGLR